MSAPALPYFFYGTLMDPDVLGIVLGHDPGPLTTAATLSGFARVRVEREPYPALVDAPGWQVEGLLMRNYAPQDDERIRYFEDFDFTIEHCSVEIGTGPETALFCGGVRNIAPTDIPWSYADWVRDEKDRFLKVAEIYMTGFGVLDPEAADQLWLETVRKIYGD